MGSDRAKRSRADQTGEHAGEPLLIRLSNRPVLLSLPFSLLRSPPLLSRGGETSKPREGDPRIRISRHDFSSPFEEDRASRGIGVDHPRTRFPFCPPPPLIGPPVCIKRQVGCALSADRPARPHESKVERNKLGRRVDIEGGKNSSRGARARARDRSSTFNDRAPRFHGSAVAATRLPLPCRSAPGTVHDFHELPHHCSLRLSSIEFPAPAPFLPSFLSFLLSSPSAALSRPSTERNFPSASSLLLGILLLEQGEREREGERWLDIPPPSSSPSPRTRPSTAV